MTAVGELGRDIRAREFDVDFDELFFGAFNGGGISWVAELAGTSVVRECNEFRATRGGVPFGV